MSSSKTFRPERHVVALRANTWSIDLYVGTKSLRIPNDLGMEVIAALADKLAGEHE